MTNTKETNATLLRGFRISKCKRDVRSKLEGGRIGVGGLKVVRDWMDGSQQSYKDRESDETRKLHRVWGFSKVWKRNN